MASLPYWAKACGPALSKMPGQASTSAATSSLDEGRIGERVEMDVGDDQEHALVGAGANGRAGLLAGRAGSERQQRRCGSDRQGSCDPDPQGAPLPVH